MWRHALTLNHQIVISTLWIFQKDFNVVNAVGLILSLIVFVIEIIIHKTSLRRAAGVTQEMLEVDHYYQSGDREESSLSVVKTVRNKSKKNYIMAEEKMTGE